MSMEVIGGLSEILGEVKYEWRIEDFLRLSNEIDTCYASPDILFSGTSWYISIHPNGQSRYDSDGWISVFLGKKSSDTPVTVNYSLSLKTVDGTAYKDETHSNRLFEGNGRGIPQFIRRSELIERASELLPSGALTVICSLKNSEKNDDGFRKLQQNLKELLFTESVSDVTLIVNDHKFKAHRSILAARSPVFMAMMSHETKEKISGVVEIPDIDPNTFPDFLNYLYTGNMENVTSQNVVKLYIAADKYQVDELKKACVDNMVKNMTVDNFCQFLTLSFPYAEERLTNACSQFFHENALDIIVTPNWQIFLRGNPTAGNKLYIKHLKQLQENVKRKRRC